MSQTIPCFICGAPYLIEQMAAAFSFPAGTPNLLSLAIRNPQKPDEFIYQQTSAIGFCIPCQRAVMTVRRANNG